MSHETLTFKLRIDPDAFEVNNQAKYRFTAELYLEDVLGRSSEDPLNKVTNGIFPERKGIRGRWTLHGEGVCCLTNESL